VSLLSDIVRTYSDPSAVVAKKISGGIGERQVLGYLVGALLISFLVRVPEQIAIAQSGITGATTDALVGGLFAAMLIFAPLFLYLLAGLSHLVAKLFGGTGTWFGARLALFWTLLSLQPVVLALFVINIAQPPIWASRGFAAVGATMFLWIWLRTLQSVSRAPAA